MYKEKINKNVYVYQCCPDGDDYLEYCNLFYDKNNDVYFVVPDSCYKEFKDTHDIINDFKEVKQPNYFN